MRMNAPPTGGFQQHRGSLEMTEINGPRDRLADVAYVLRLLSYLDFTTTQVTEDAACGLNVIHEQLAQWIEESQQAGELQHAPSEGKHPLFAL
jgi:hypothetical protein